MRRRKKHKQELAKQSSMLPLKSTTENDFVLTVFWADNFDMNLEAQCGGGAINITHLMALQEVTDRAEYISNKVNVTESKRSVRVEETPGKQVKVNVKKEQNGIVNCATNNKEYAVLSSQFGKTFYVADITVSVLSVFLFSFWLCQ